MPYFLLPSKTTMTHASDGWDHTTYWMDRCDECTEMCWWLYPLHLHVVTDQVDWIYVQNSQNNSEVSFYNINGKIKRKNTAKRELHAKTLTRLPLVHLPKHRRSIFTLNFHLFTLKYTQQSLPIVHTKRTRSFQHESPFFIPLSFLFCTHIPPSQHISTSIACYITHSMHSCH